MATLQLRKIGEALSGDEYDVVFEALVFRTPNHPQPAAEVSFRVHRIGDKKPRIQKDTTDEQGFASTSFRLDPGNYVASAILDANTIIKIPQFSLKAPSRVPARIEREILTDLPSGVRALTYAVFDERGSGLPNIPLTCTILVMFGGTLQQRVTTDATGRVEIEVAIPAGRTELMFVLRHAGTDVEYVERVFA